MNPYDLNELMTMNPADKPVDCFECEHFYVTWEVAHPRGCRAFGFKTPNIPSYDVLEASGQPCLKFTQKVRDNANNDKSKGWFA